MFWFYKREEYTNLVYFFIFKIMNRTFKNILFLVTGIAYFFFYNSDHYSILTAYVEGHIVYGHIVLSYVTAIIWLFTSLGLISLINRYIEAIFLKIFHDNDKLIFVLEFFVNFISITKYIIAFYIFSYLAILPEWLEWVANKIYSIALLVIFLFFSSRFVNKFFQHDLIEKSKLKTVSKNLLPFVNKVIIALIWVVGIIMIIWNLWYDVTALVAGAWIWGLAIAFAAQKSIANVFGAITILLNKPFNIGDFITVNGITWVVKDIGLSYLTVVDIWGHQVMIPNEVIISTNVENFSVRKNRRTDCGVGLIYGTTLAQMEKWVKGIEDILEKYVWEKTIAHYRVHFDSFWDFSLNINFTYFSLVNDNYKDYLKQKEQINLEIKKNFKTAKLEMAFPTQEIILKKED